MNLSLTDQGPHLEWGKSPNRLRGYASEREASSTGKVPERKLIQRYEHQMLQFAAEWETEISKLKGEFIFDTPSTVTDYLKAHRALASLLLESVEPLRQSFGYDVPLKLQIRTDGNSPILYATVIWKGPICSARAALEKFDENWWLENVRIAPGDVVLDYELV